MPIPLWLGHFNSRYTNNLTRPFAGVLPWFGVVEHVGRRSGRVYRSPVNLFPRGDRYVFAMTYGHDAQWVKNVQAAGACRVRTHGRWVQLTEPRLFTDSRRHAVPGPVRLPLALLGVTEFMEMRAAQASAIASPDPT